MMEAGQFRRIFREESNGDQESRPARPAPVHQDHGDCRCGRGDDALICALCEGAGKHAEARLCQPADRAAGSLRRGRRVHPRAVPRDGEERARHRRQELCGRGHRQGFAIQSEPRRRSRQGADRRRRDRPDAGRLDAGNHQSGVDPVRDRGGALHLHHGAVAAVVHRPPGQSGRPGKLDAVQAHIPLFLGAGRRDRRLHQHVEPARDQQGGRRAVPQRRRRQRLGRSRMSASRRC